MLEMFLGVLLKEVLDIKGHSKGCARLGGGSSSKMLTLRDITKYLNIKNHSPNK